MCLSRPACAERPARPFLFAFAVFINANEPATRKALIQKPAVNFKYRDIIVLNIRWP
jgi:hypothetical protein